MVVSLSADSEADAAANAAAHQLRFPIAYGIDPHEVQARIGSYVSDGNDGHPIHTQATGFVLTPDSTVFIAVYSSSAIGRLVAADVIGAITYAQQSPSPSGS